MAAGLNVGAAASGAASAWAFAAAALACMAAADLAAGLRFGHAHGRAASALVAALDGFARIGSEGRDPNVVERRRMLALVALAALVAGWFTAGLPVALAAAAAAPSIGARALRARRDRYRRAVDAGAAEIAVALADALAGGRSLRGAVVAAAGSLHGPPGHELTRVAAELELGARTDDALEAMRGRIRSTGIDAIVSGALLQRAAGGDLALLLRKAARSLEEEQRLLGDVRAATAQARFTGIVVALLPLGGGLLAELASPGFAIRLVTSPLSAWLLGMAVAMQCAAAYAIRRVARVRA